MRVEHALVTLPVGDTPPTTYFTVHNAGVLADSLLGVTADVAVRVTMHTQQQHRMPMGGRGSVLMSLMAPVTAVAIPAGGEVQFAPGGLRGTLEAIRRPLVRGDSVRMTLYFTGGRSTTTVARVITYAELDSALGSMTAPSSSDGRALYRSNGCVSCHGPDGHGDGPIAPTLDPLPRDFRDSAAFKHGTDAAAIAQTLATGIPGGGAMPLFAHLTNAERLALARFVISLRVQTSNRIKQP